MKYIDNLLNQITMYRLVFYYLLFLVGAAAILSLFGFLSFTPLALLATTAFFLVVCYVTNKVFAYVFEAPANIESVYISALILSLIVAPARNLHDFPVLFWMGAIAMASKFIIAINKKHIFNPAAFAVFLTSLTIGGSANWWIGSAAMLPFVIFGLLVVRKIRRYDLVFYYVVAALATIITLSFLRGSQPLVTLQKTIFDSPILFFAFIMLTEPITTPPTKKLQSIYGVLVGFLFAPQLHFGSFFTTPETALLLGNIYSYLVSSKAKFIMTLQEQAAIGENIVDFVFKSSQRLVFSPGQYMEWTLPHGGTDARGNRRYFTIASSPTEKEVLLGVRFYENSSTFKKALIALKPEDKIIASQVAGDFTLPKDKSKKLVFIAGGIGVTPFRSIVKYLTDKNEARDIVILYINRTVKDIVYRDILSAAQKVGVKTFYFLSGRESVVANSEVITERLDENKLKALIPDFVDRVYYISGRESLVDDFKQMLGKMGVGSNKIVTDYFPGLA